MRENLGIYINDHLAGSVAALQLIDQLLENETDPALDILMYRLKEEIPNEQQALRDILDANDLHEGSIKKVAAWLAEKVTSPKFSKARRAGDNLPLMQALEMLYVGITGKWLLWKGFSKVSDVINLPEGVNCESLRTQAESQLRAVEVQRLVYADKAFNEDGRIAA